MYNLFDSLLKILNKNQQLQQQKMNKKQQELFVAFFEEVYQAQQAFEQIKKKMKSCKSYDPVALFNLISAGDSRIEISRLRNYLSDKITCNERELYELFEKMDISRQGFISQRDFLRQITPLVQQMNTNYGSGQATAELQGYFLSLLMQYIKRLRILQVSRKQVYFIQPYNAFAQIDNFKTGIIGLGQLQRFLRNNDYNISEYQLVLLLHGLRRRCYLQVNLQVFCENLDPLEFGYYQQYQAVIQSDKQAEFLKRSRKQQQTMRRSRIQSKKIQQNIAKQERRRRADIDRELDLEQRINGQILEQEKQKQRYIRRAILQEDKNIRWNIQTGSHALEAEKQRHLVDKLRNQQLHIIRNQQNDIKNVLARSAYQRQDDIQNSRRVRYNIQRQRQIQRQIQLQQQLQRKQVEILKERALRQEIQRDKQLQRKQYLARQRALIQEDRLRQYSKRQSALDFDKRRLYQQQLLVQRNRAQRQYQLQRIKNLDLGNTRPYQTASNSRRVTDLQRELQRTRLQMRQRQSRLNLTQSKKQPETAERSHRGYKL